MSATTKTVTLINAFEVPSQADEPFIAGWERARDFLAGQDGFSETALHRALRPDAVFRFVNVARGESPEAWRRAIADPAFPGGKMRFAAHPGLYEVVHEDGACDAADGVILINAFDVPADEDERFLAEWHHARHLLASRPGYSALAFTAASGPPTSASSTSHDGRARRRSRRRSSSRAFRDAAAAMPFPSHPALYEVIRD
jgi:heme oxygenase (mycobilin-producing)